MSIDNQIPRSRPLSPHLSIYRLQLTSGLSILHRITGAYLYTGLLLLSWIIFSMIFFPNCLKEMAHCIFTNNFTAIIFKLALFGWTFALYYHLLNGIRHLFWDAGKGFDLKIVYLTGYIVLGLSMLLTILSWVSVYYE